MVLNVVENFSNKKKEKGTRAGGNSTIFDMVIRVGFTKKVASTDVKQVREPPMQISQEKYPRTISPNALKSSMPKVSTE